MGLVNYLLGWMLPILHMPGQPHSHVEEGHIDLRYFLNYRGNWAHQYEMVSA